MARGRHSRRRRQHRARASAASPASTSPSTRTSTRSRSPASTATGRRIVQASRRQPEEGAARARRQGRQHRVRRCQHAGRGQRLGLGHLPQPGAGLHRRLAADPAREDRRRVPRAVHRRWRSRSALGNPLDADDRDGPADRRAAPRPRARLCRSRARAGRRDPDRRQGAGRDGACAAAATSSRRWCGRSRPTASRRKRCSARSSPCSPSRTTKRRWRSPTAPTTASAAACGRPTCSARTTFAARCAAGMVWINCYKRVNPGSPFGGVGRAATAARWASKRCASTPQVKTVWVNVDAKIPPVLSRADRHDRDFTYTSHAAARGVRRRRAGASRRARSSAGRDARAGAVARRSSADSAERVAALLGDAAAGVFAEAP